MTSFNLMILAAGYGKRMNNLTHSIPKPLLKINNRELLRHNIDFFTNLGCKKIIINTHYLHNKIKHFIEEYYLDRNIILSYEPTLLNTGGGIKNALSFLADNNFVVTNCDVVTDINYHNFFEHHIKKDAYLSILGLEKSTKVPYGVLRLDKESNVEGLQEKPKQTHTIMTGIYIINKRALDYIPSDVEFGMDELIETLIANNKAVTSFVIKDGWYDMGQFSEYKKLLMHIDN